ncbi:MAG: hypothetical protein KDD78_03105 [Caldilineaceae bacterium]|nr:hypothetical protein [Caldilineaceae bacterium]
MKASDNIVNANINSANVIDAGFLILAMLVINIMWNFLIWHEILTWLRLAGASLTLASGLFVLYRAPR